MRRGGGIWRCVQTGRGAGAGACGVVLVFRRRRPPATQPPQAAQHTSDPAWPACRLLRCPPTRPSCCTPVLTPPHVSPDTAPQGLCAGEVLAALQAAAAGPLPAAFNSLSTSQLVEAAAAAGRLPPIAVTDESVAGLWHEFDTTATGDANGLAADKAEGAAGPSAAAGVAAAARTGVASQKEQAHAGVSSSGGGWAAGAPLAPAAGDQASPLITWKPLIWFRFHSVHGSQVRSQLPVSCMLGGARGACLVCGGAQVSTDPTGDPLSALHPACCTPQAFISQHCQLVSEWHGAATVRHRGPPPTAPGHQPAPPPVRSPPAASVKEQQELEPLPSPMSWVGPGALQPPQQGQQQPGPAGDEVVSSSYSRSLDEAGPSSSEAGPSSSPATAGGPAAASGVMVAPEPALATARVPAAARAVGPRGAGAGEDRALGFASAVAAQQYQDIMQENNVLQQQHLQQGMQQQQQQQHVQHQQQVQQQLVVQQQASLGEHAVWQQAGPSQQPGQLPAQPAAAAGPVSSGSLVSGMGSGDPQLLAGGVATSSGTEDGLQEGSEVDTEEEEEEEAEQGVAGVQQEQQHAWLGNWLVDEFGEDLAQVGSALRGAPQIRVGLSCRPWARRSAGPPCMHGAGQGT